MKEEKENENKNLLIRCQEAEKSKLLAEETANKELIELRNNLEQLHTEVRDDSILIDRFIWWYIVNNIILAKFALWPQTLFKLDKDLMVKSSLSLQLNSNKGEIKLVLEKMEKQKEESEKKLEDEKKLTRANTKSLQADLQSKQDVSFKKFAWTWY